jgi:hypothetical protein
MAEPTEQAVCQFYRLIPDAPAPQRADPSALGTMTVAAYQYCEAMRTASAFGWQFRPPMNFSLLLDDDELFWTPEGEDGLYPINAGVQFPNFLEVFNRVAPPELMDLAPPFLAQGSVPGSVQIWSGFLARTARRWALLSRGIANYRKTQSYKNLEGLLETSMLFEPMIATVQLARTNVPIHFHKRRPFFQVQPLLRECYHKPPFEVFEASDLTEDDWQQFAATLKPNLDLMRKPGHYAVAVRKEFHRDGEATS